MAGDTTPTPTPTAEEDVPTDPASYAQLFLREGVAEPLHVSRVYSVLGHPDAQYDGEYQVGVAFLRLVRVDGSSFPLRCTHTVDGVGCIAHQRCGTWNDRPAYRLVPPEGAEGSADVARCLYYWRSELPESDEVDAEAAEGGAVWTHTTEGT